MDDDSIDIQVMYDPPSTERNAIGFHLSNNSTDRNKAESIDLSIITNGSNHAILGIPPEEMIQLAKFLNQYAKDFIKRRKYLEDYKE